MNVIYADSEQKYVKNVILYGETGKVNLYVDEECEDKSEIDRETLLKLVKSGLIVCYDLDYYFPIAFSDETTYATVTIATAVSASSSTSVVLKSNEQSS